MLIKKGADINVMILARRRMRLTILHWAATDGKFLAIIKYFQKNFSIFVLNFDETLFFLC